MLVLVWEGRRGRHLAEQAKGFARLEDTDKSQLNTINDELKAFISDWANFQTAVRFAKSALEKAMSDVPSLKWQAEIDGSFPTFGGQGEMQSFQLNQTAKDSPMTDCTSACTPQVEVESRESAVL